jgi:hypothetical protein
MKVKIDENENRITYLTRDNFRLLCPRSIKNGAGIPCGPWCPAHTQHPKSGIDPEWIELKCFPNEVKFEVEEAK